MDGGQLLDTLKRRPCDASHGISDVPRVEFNARMIKP